MPFSKSKSLLALAVLGFSTGALSAEKPYEAMDYGRFFSATFNNTKGKPTFDQNGCAANKGIVVKLGAEEDGAMLFDTDLLRMAGGWTGGFFKKKGVAFDGGHGPNPLPPDGAQMFFETNPTGPGWSKGADFHDPRPLPTGPGAATIPFGPLPHAWAKYRGLYLHGEDVVLSYTVGTAAILEKPGIMKNGETATLTRTFEVTSPGEASTLLVAEGGEGATAEQKDGAIVFRDPQHGAESAIVISAAGLPAGAAWEIVAPARVLLKLPALQTGQNFVVGFAAASEPPAPLPAPALLHEMTKGGPAHWPQEVTVAGSLGAAEHGFPYAVDTITLPIENPYHSWMRVGALDFFSDGRLAFSTWSGDVWIGQGIDQKLDKITWHRFATGLFQPLGLKIVRDEIYVLGRDQITHLVDLNHDGEADFYQCFNNDVQVTPGFHEFAFDLQTDPQGNFYFAKGGPVNPGGRGWGPLSDHNGCLFKVSPDGEKFEVYATGLRAPNGLGVSPTGQVTIGDNQGTWVPVDYIHDVQPGEFIEVPDLSHRTPVPDHFTQHLCWIPYDADNSCGSHVWVTSDRFGPLKDQMLYLSYGKSCIFAVLREAVGNTMQGGVVKLPLKFATGIMRARFNPQDGQLYVGGLRGWQTNGAKEGAIQRVRYTGETATLPSALRVTDQGIHIGFTAPVETATASDPENYALEQYNYHWTHDYGSPEFKVSDPTQKGRDAVEVKSVRVSPDKKEVFLEIPGLKPVMQMRIKMKLKAENGADLPEEIGNTINIVPPEPPPHP